MMIQVDFLQKKNVDSNPYDSDLMAKDFIQHFNNQAFSVGQQVTPTRSRNLSVLSWSLRTETNSQSEISPWPSACCHPAVGV